VPGQRHSPGMMKSYQAEGLRVAAKKVAVTLPEELFEMVERARKIEHRSRSELIQEALRTHFGVPAYVPSDEERRMLDEALADLGRKPDSGRPWEEVRREVWPRG
jgi:Arc/MetJ-type ribon-helix-helix transcriptional regulator